MKALICGDVHWSKFSSIVRMVEDKMSYRLKNLIESVNFVERTAEQNDCDMIIYLGDFFDDVSLSAMELSALSEVQWSTIPKYFLVGNHEIEHSEYIYSTVDVFKGRNSIFNVVSSPTVMSVDDFSKFYFMPYTNEPYDDKLIDLKNNIIGKIYLFSHNDISGIQYGNYVSTFGFNLDTLRDSCCMCFNGHLHNASRYDNVINVGNLTGQNFSEDASKYPHGVYLLNTETSTYRFIENDCAMKFYSLDLSNCSEDEIVHTLKTLPKNSVVSVTANSDSLDIIKSTIKECEKIIAHKITLSGNMKTEFTTEVKDTTVDYKSLYYEYIKNKYMNTPFVEEELAEVCK